MKGIDMIGAQVIVKMLEEYGVEYIFGVPGDTSIKLYEALHDSKFQTLCKPFMEIYNIERGEDGYNGKNPIENSNFFMNLFLERRKQDKCGRQQKQKMNPPLDAGLENPDGGRIELED